MSSELSIDTIAPRLEQLGVSIDQFREKVSSLMAFKVPQNEAIRSAIKYFSQEKGFDAKDAYGAVRYTVSGVVVGFQSGSGLIERCPECEKALYKAQCNKHGKVEGVSDLRLKMLVDDGKAIFSVVVNSELTEELTGIDVERAKQIAAEHLDRSVILDMIEAKLLCRYVTATVTCLGDYYIAKEVTIGKRDVSTAPPVQSLRNVAYRISAMQFDASVAGSEPVEGFDHESKFVTTPKGVKVNRVFLVGALLNPPEGDNGTIKCRIIDQTGSILLMAGDYTPEARQKLAEIRTPTYLAVIGKVTWFQTREEKFVKYIRPEEVVAVDESIQKLWESDVREAI